MKVGAIVSKELDKAQKEAGAVYRRELASELERLGYRLDRTKEGFRVAAIPRDVEKMFSKRRQAIEEAARTHGYRTAKGMQLATLRTRRAKGAANLDERFKSWQAEAKAAGFELGREQRQPLQLAAAARSPIATSQGRSAAPSSARTRVSPHRCCRSRERCGAGRPSRSSLGSALGDGRPSGQAPQPGKRKGVTGKCHYPPLHRSQAPVRFPARVKAASRTAVAQRASLAHGLENGEPARIGATAGCEVSG